MSYREIPEDRILSLRATPGFRGWSRFFTKESVTHPAKMNLNLLRWILETYTEPGEAVLDPMAGTGSTAVLAALKGRHGVAVEYEPKFCEMIKGNIELANRQPWFASKGKMACIQGDARELSRLLEESDVIVTSPPYGNRLSDVAIDDGDPARMSYRQTVDMVLTSPPFGPSQRGGGIAKEGYKAPGEDEVSDPDLPQRHGRPVSDNPHNIDNLPYGESVDAVITSPPYEATCLDSRNAERRAERLKEAGYDPKDFLGGQGRDATLKDYDKVDNVITSPPYEGGPFNHAGGHGGAYAGGIAQRDPNLKPMTLDSENIGTLKGETYLEAMLRVYRECWKVLRAGGRMVIVVKNFIREKQVVRLDLDTIRLCEAAGFRLADRWYLRLPTRSFWKILYHRKYPDVPEVEHEDVLVFEKVGEWKP